MISTNTFYTKCGREFKKSTKADTTGYTIDPEDKECADCQFQVDVKKGWPPVHDKWECRAGSKPPNHKNEWSGSTEDKNTIHIKSLDNDFLESIIEYCKGQPDLGAGYNQDLPDCRRTVSVSCSSNKKGMAAKKELIEKFFPEPEKKNNTCPKYKGSTGPKVAEFPVIKCGEASTTYGRDKIKDWEKKLDNCLHSPEKCCLSPLYKSNKPIKEQPVCTTCGHVFEEKCDIHNTKRSQDDSRNSCIGCTYWQSMSEVTNIRCENCEGFSFTTPSCTWGKCDKGCAKGKIHKNTFVCGSYKQKEQEVQNMSNVTENVSKSTNFVNESSGIVSKEPESVTEFDYSSVDNETATFLQEKANKITEIRIKSVIALGKELKEAHDRLASFDKNKGTYMAWLKSIKISWDTADRHIKAFEYVSANCGMIEDAEKIQPSLLFAISKTSAPEDLQKAVLSGDITSNKEYQEALKAKGEAEQEAQRAIEEKKQAEFEAREFERKYKARESAIETHKQALDEEKKRRYQLELDLKRAQEKGDSEEVKSLQHEIENYQTQIGSLNVQMQKLEKQLKDKPIEVAASKVVEKLPDEIMDAVYKKVASLYESILNITETEIQVFAQGVDPDQYDDIVQKISEAIGILNNIDTAVYETTKATNEAAATTERKTAPCEDCQYCTWEGLKEEDENAGKVICKMYNALVENEKGCRNFVER